jgi:hypothetical protein
VTQLIRTRCARALGHDSSTRLVRERERENDGPVLMDGEGRQRGVRIEPAMERNVGGRCTSSRAAYSLGGWEIGRFWVR